MSRKRTLAIVAAGFLFYFVPITLILTMPLPFPVPTPLPTESPHVVSWSEKAPYVDRAIFKVITRPDDYVEALISGAIDHIPENIPSDYVDELKAASNVEVTMTESFSYVCLAINCQRYPCSIPGFRRALAFAIDKGELAALMYGALGYALDNPIPPACGVWYTNLTYPDYKHRSLANAKAELAAAGFADIDADGFVEAPDGSDFTFRLLYSDDDSRWAQISHASKAYWDQAGIPVQPTSIGPRQMSHILSTVPRDYDGVLINYELAPPQSSPLALAAWSSNQTSSYRTNFLNWANATYNHNVTTMLVSSDYDTVLEAAYAAQQVFIHEAPMIVLCGRYQVNAHRTDRLDGWPVSPGFGTGYQNPWLPGQVRLRSGDPERDPVTGNGGTLYSMIATEIDSSNPLISTSVYGQYPLSQVYYSLTGLKDTRTHIATKFDGGLAYDWTITVLADCLQFDFTLYQNATWHDGVPVSADDVAFSYNYIKDHAIATYSTTIGYLKSCVAIDDYHVRIITEGPSAKSYWAWGYLAGWPILPEHIWEGIVSPLTFANPAPVGFGPFRWKRYIEGEYIELRFWEGYHKGGAGHVVAVPSALGYPLRLILLGVTITVLVSVSSILYLRVPPRQPGSNR